MIEAAVLFFFLIFTQGYVYWLGGRERETLVWERNIDWLPPECVSVGDGNCNLGMCPHQELNPEPFDVQDNAPTNWPTQPELCSCILIEVESYILFLPPLDDNYKHFSYCYKTLLKVILYKMCSDNTKIWGVWKSVLLLIFHTFPCSEVVLTLPDFLKIDLRERNIDLLFPWFMHSLVDSWMYPDQVSDLQPWLFWAMLLTNWRTQPEPSRLFFLCMCNTYRVFFCFVFVFFLQECDHFVHICFYQTCGFFFFLIKEPSLHKNMWISPVLLLLTTMEYSLVWMYYSFFTLLPIVYFWVIPKFFVN